MSSEFSRSHFELFGLAPSFEIDEVRLAEVYRQLQRTVHPDRYAGASDQERRLSVQRAAQVNEAYQTLKDPYRRARYLLALYGIDVQEESNTIMDAEFLMEQMELRESLAGVHDARDPHGELLVLRRDIEQRVAALRSQLRDLFRDATPESLEHAGEVLRKMRFLNRLLQEAEEVEERIA